MTVVSADQTNIDLTGPLSNPGQVRLALATYLCSRMMR